MSYRVCIPTAGIGSRLGEQTRFINKSLVAIANRPTLCHLIEQFPDDVEFVIALGHKGHLVRDFIELTYPDRIFYFSEVLPFEGKGSGLGLSLLKCKEHLQQPFIFISCDTLIKGEIKAPDHNWMGYAEVEDLSQYRTLSITEQKDVHEICEKGQSGNDLMAYIGLAGIYDYQKFWQSMEEGGVNAITSGEAHGMRALIDYGIKSYVFQWFDTGNPVALEKTREVYKEPDSPNILDKANEAIWFIGEKVIKFSDDEEFIKNRVARFNLISEFTPKLIDSRANMYLYKKVHGDVLSNVVTIPLFKEFLSTAKIFWQSNDLELKEKEHFKNSCMKFYKDKTEQRIQLFYNNFNKKDGAERINNEEMPTLEALLNQIDWEWLADGLPGRFHGDFHFENILWSREENRFVFLDWRQDFGGSLDTGDIYYDLAKLMHGLIISHELIGKELFYVTWEEDDIKYDFHRKQVLVECMEKLSQWIECEGFDNKKVMILTALIYLNIAALHHDPYSLLLYALGKRMLKKELTL